MNIKAAAVSFISAVTLCAGQVFAWGGEGHQVVALIAENHLTPEASAGIHALLGDDVNISDAEVASWADQIKRERGRPSTASWHYVNIPIDAAGYDAKRDSPKSTDLIEATASQIAAISDTSLPTDKRAEALKFVVHFIGDLHQPLHCGDRDDRGGNSVPVYVLKVDGKPTNLHAAWDTALLKIIKAGERVAPYADKLDAKITPEQAAAWKAGNLIAWANESHDVARDHVYKGVPVPVKPSGELITAEASPVHVLDQAYVDDAKPVIEQQLERGGIRLAAVLNKAFGHRGN